MGEEKSLQESLSVTVRERFAAAERLRSYSEFLARVATTPRAFSRSAPQYVLDAIDHYGRSTADGLGGKVERLNIFDAPFAGGRDQVHGQEQVQAEVYQTIRNFVTTGRNDRLILLHGPNGSAKSSIVDAILRGLEHYSRLPEGALYRFYWVFPRQKVPGRQVGFESGVGAGAAVSTYAYLELDEIAARIPCELRDHPLFLLPPPERAQVLGGPDDDTRPLSPWILDGDLCPKCKAIYEALLTSYGGDLARVLAHVQVERYFVSKRYRLAAVTIDPQVTADATARQITMDRSLSDLPSYLQNLSLFQMMGDLIDGSGGMVEFSDLLKRSVEANKYLLTACETGFITMGTVSAALNLVMIGSSNERHLDMFKKSADFTSFKGRFKLIQTPYLVEYGKEARIYDDQLAAMTAIKHLAPHTTRLAALWAVLTRLRRPDPASYPTEVRETVRKLGPLAKAKLYDRQETPPHLDAKEKNALRSVIRRMREEYRDDPRYEGRYGASPREIRDVLLDCFYDRQWACVSPQALFAALAKLVQDRSLYEFLNLEPDNLYHDAARFIEDAREEYLDRVNEEVRDSLELVAEDEYVKLFERYVLNVKAYVKRETLFHDMTRSHQPPDEHLMEQVERVLDVDGETTAFRQSLIGRIGAWRMDHGHDVMDYGEVFPEYLSRLKEDFYRDRRKVIEQISRHLLTVGTDEFGLLDPEVQVHVRGALERMRDRYGYCEWCAKEAIVLLMRKRYT